MFLKFAKNSKVYILKFSQRKSLRAPAAQTRAHLSHPLGNKALMTQRREPRRRQTRRKSLLRARTIRRSPRSKTAAVIQTMTQTPLLTLTPSQLSLKEPELHPM